MRALQLLLASVLLPLICGNSVYAQQTPAQEMARRIAVQSGIDGWPDVKVIAFTFNVEREGKVTSRSWIWKPREQEVTAVEKGITYSQIAIADEHKKLDAQFINDKYWLLFPYHLVWDKSATLSLSEEKVAAPISGKPHHKLTVQYPTEGGYTPGDAYDLFVDDEYSIVEWTFRKGGQQEPSMSATWENYRSAAGQFISMNHKFKSGGRLWFTDLAITTDIDTWTVESP